jgi:hypothetical protein
MGPARGDALARLGQEWGWTEGAPCAARRCLPIPQLFHGLGECVTSLLAFMDLNWRNGRYVHKDPPPNPSSHSSPDR